MRKEELIREISMHTGIDRGDIREVVKATAMIIKTCIMNGEEIHIEGVGTFTTKRRPVREFYNPTTGELEMSREMDVPYFKVHPKLRKFVKDTSAEKYSREEKINGSGTEG